MFVTVIIALPSISEVCFKYRFIKKFRTYDLSYVHCQGKCEWITETQNQSPIRGSLFFWDRT
jgi:hypothetical protein